MPRAGVPFQVDLGTVRRPHDFDAMLDRLRADEPFIDQHRGDLLLAALVSAVVEPLALLRLEALERGLHGFELRRFAGDDDAFLAHDHRLARLHADRRSILRRLRPLQLARDVGAVVAERFERLARLVVGALEQPADLHRRNVAILVLGQLDARPHGFQHVAFDTFDDDGDALGTQWRGE